MAFRRTNGVFYTHLRGRRVSLRTQDPDEADERERAARAAEGPSVRAVLAAWLEAGRVGGWRPRTATLYAATAARFEERWGDRPASSLGRADIEEYKRARRKAPATVNFEVGALVSALAHAAEVGLLPHDQVPRFGRWRIRTRPAAPEYLTREEFDCLLAADREGKLRTALFLARFAGLREQEVLKLRWKDVDLARGWITVRDSKTGDRRIPLARVLHDELERARAITKEYVIEVVPGRPWSKSGLDHRVTRTFRRAKIEARGGHTLHLLRSTFATMWTGTMRDLQVVLGHSSIVTTQRYLAHRPEGQRAGVEGAAAW